MKPELFIPKNERLTAKSARLRRGGLALAGIIALLFLFFSLQSPAKEKVQQKDLKLRKSDPVQKKEKELPIAQRGQAEMVKVLPGSEKRWALLIGVANYDDPNISQLSAPDHDARRLREALLKYAGFRESQVILLTSDQTESDYKPTRRNVLFWLSRLKKNVEADGLFLFSFSGHGIEVEKRAFLMPMDATITNDVETLGQLALDVKIVRDYIDATPAKQKLVFLDACRNDPRASKGLGDNLLTDTLVKGFNFESANREVDASVTLFATKIGHRAYENVKGKYGYFTDAMVKALEGKAKDDQGNVTLAALIKYVEEEVPRQTKLVMPEAQYPFANVSGYKADELVIAKIPLSSESPNAVSEPTTVRENSDASNPTPQQVIPEKKPALPKVVLARKLSLGTYQFDVVKVDTTGKVRERRKEQARYFSQELTNGIKLEMVFIPGGTFPMGLADAEIENDERNAQARNEQNPGEPANSSTLSVRTMLPQRLVTVVSFYAGKYEVTQAQWREVANSPRVKLDLSPSPSHFKGDNRPVEQVSWNEAVEFCARLSRDTGRRYRLPSEAEWEYACRSGTTTPFYFGETISIDLANYNGLSDDHLLPKGPSSAGTVLVGSKGAANAFGLYDMHGNVLEWCLDAWHDSYEGAPSDGIPWEKGANTRFRVIRGGSWRTDGRGSRSAERYRGGANLRLSHIGLRIVMDAGRL